MSGLLVDRSGRAWPDNSWTLARRLGYDDAALSVADFAVERAGCIHVTRRAASAHLALASGRFTQAALLGAMLALETAPKRMALSLLEDGRWSHEVFDDQADAVAFAEELAIDEPTGPRLPWLATGLRLDALAQPRLAPLRPLLQLWQESRGRLPPGLAALLGPRGIILRRDGHHWRWEAVPTATVIMRPCEWLTRIGRRIDDQPDPAYAEWVGNAYRATVERERPRLDLVRAITPAIDGAIIRTRYHRFQLPWRSAAGDAYVSVVSIRRRLAVSPPASHQRTR